jgi:Mycotoxin biosynthesis protein UstYa
MHSLNFSQGYFALSEGAHQLHCLHALWRDHHISEYPEAQETRDKMPHIYELHIEHCVDMIRQQLMCKYDTGFITFRWIEGLDIPYPDFNTVHKCKNYDAIREWSATHEARVPNNWTWPSMPKDAVTLKSLP